MIEITLIIHKINPAIKKIIRPQDSTIYNDKTTGLDRGFFIKNGVRLILYIKQAINKRLKNILINVFFKIIIFLFEQTEHKNKTIIITPPKKTKVKK